MGRGREGTARNHIWESRGASSDAGIGAGGVSQPGFFEEMNFLEQLAAEWYAYCGYFVRTNVKFGKRAKGGWEGEVDVLAVRPHEKELVHLETSMDALPWHKRRERFSSKFHKAGTYYEEMAGFKPRRITRIAVASFSHTPPNISFDSDIEIRLIPEFITEIQDALKKKHPMREAVPEGYPILRALQFAAFARKQTT